MQVFFNLMFFFNASDFSIEVNFPPTFFFNIYIFFNGKKIPQNFFTVNSLE